jgi:hypothetical protein
MSNRERWTVYPLLFLALGVSLRDKITDSVEVRSITCEDLAVMGRDGKTQVRLFVHGPQSGRLIVFGQNGNAAISLGTNEDGSSGQLAVYSADGKPQIVAKSVGQAGAIETLTSTGVPQVILSSNKAVGSGSIETRSAAGAPQVVLNSSNRGGLVTTIDNEKNLFLSLGHDAQASGLFAFDAKKGVSSTLPLLHQAPPKDTPSDGGVDSGQPPKPLSANPPKDERPKPDHTKPERHKEKVPTPD